MLPLTWRMLPKVCQPSCHQIALVVCAQVWENENGLESVVIHPRTVILGLTFDCLKIFIASCQWKLRLLQSC